MAKEINWWKNSLIYQIYPLSFKDSNDDGIGDINGIISKLDYLKDLGVDVIWLSPIYQSPMDDNGYDISNYYEINSMFGTFDDFKNLLSEVHKRGLKLIMDLVVNHTSDEHHWFLDAKENKQSPYRDYYIWEDKPNNIESVFSGSAWEYEPITKQYFFHLFSKKQPDLNWDNEKLRKEIYQMINYWLDLGVDGFRLDVIDLIGKDINQKQLADGPHLDERLKEMYEACFKGRDIMTVGETPGISIKRAKELSEKYLNMVFQFSHISLDEIAGKGKWFLKDLDLKELKETFNYIQNVFEEDGWTSLFWSNHDQPRAVSRYGNDKEYRVESAKMLFASLYLLKGTPFVFQGEELGMTKANFKKIEDYRDIESINMYYDFLNKGIGKKSILKSLSVKSRDNSRTPMQWSSDKYGGFSSVSPWLKSNKNYVDINGAKEITDQNSVYHFVKKLFEYRKDNLTIIYGKTQFIDIDSTWLFSYKRKYLNKTIYVISNFSNNVREELKLDISSYKVVLNNYNIDYKNIITKLRPYEVIVLEKDDDNAHN